MKPGETFILEVSTTKDMKDGQLKISKFISMMTADSPITQAFRCPHSLHQPSSVIPRAAARQGMKCRLDQVQDLNICAPNQPHSHFPEAETGEEQTNEDG